MSRDAWEDDAEGKSAKFKSTTLTPGFFETS